MSSWNLLLKVLTFLLLFPSASHSQTWFTQTSGVSAHLFSVYFINENTGWVGTVDGNVLKTTNGGASWMSYSTGFSIGINSLYFTSSAAGFACGDLGKVLVTSNGGTTWSAQVSSTSSSLFKIRFINSSTGWAAGDFRTVIRTTNSGTTWVSQLSGSFDHYSVFPVSSSTVLACGFDGVIHKSINGGLNWYVPNSNVAYVLNDIYFPTATTGIAVGYGTPIPTILRSTNSGDNWSIVAAASGSGLNALHFPVSSSGWACGYDGIIMRTTDTGANWHYQITPVPGIVLKDLFFVNALTGWSVGYLGTIIKTTTGGITALNQTGTVTTRSYSLSQNYPNPFNPSTEISFDIPKASFVKLTVYDAAGLEVGTLAKEVLNAGKYSFEWDASSYPSGVYFYKLQAGEFIQTKKMVLVK